MIRQSFRAEFEQNKGKSAALVMQNSCKKNLKVNKKKTNGKYLVINF